MGISSKTIRPAPLFAALLLLWVHGCGDPYTMYQAPGDAPVAEGRKILVLPFMDTRTLRVKDDPHNEDLAFYTRDLFVEVLRQHPQGTASVILTPDMDAPDRSFSNAEVAELGRQHGADVVLAGQIFSFTDTRAASIPPRAGMFVRAISARSGALLFVGDHYQAASVPRGGGWRDQQARIVSARLVEGLFAQAGPTIARAGEIASAAALAMLPVAPAKRVGTASGGRGRIRTNNNTAPDGQRGTLSGFSGGTAPDTVEWDENMIPMPPPLLDFDDEPTASLAPPPAPDSEGESAAGEAEPRVDPAVAAAEPVEPVVVVEPVVAETVEPAPVSVPPTVPAADSGMYAVLIDELPELERDRVDSTMAGVDARAAVVSHVVSLSGDQLASDLFASDGDVFEPAVTETVVVPMDMSPADSVYSMPTALTADEIERVPALRFSPLELDPEAMTIRRAHPETPEPVVVVPSLPGGRMPAYAPLPGPITDARATHLAVPARGAAEVAAVTVNGGDYDPIYSEPMAVEQPRTYKLVNLTEDPASARQDDAARVDAPRKTAVDGAARVLILPYHDRINDNNLIANTGGGEVVTTLYGTQLALDPGIRLMWDATGLATHDRLIDIDEALELARLAGADYVMRGQVVEFRRAQSVPSFFSAVISTAVLAAQVFFAEMSGVDVATEVYRVSDGECVMSRRDRAQQKYVVQAEKTVRRLAIGMADSVSRVIRENDPQPMDPLIDELEPVTVLTNPR